MHKIISLALSVVLTFCYCATPPQAAGQGPQGSGDRLKFALVLTRHGVRSPTWTNARLDEYAAQPWPRWPVEPGLLTPHGKVLMTLFGAYYRQAYAAQGLLSATRCEDAAHIYIRADTDDRTLATGRGLADGLAPGCPLEVHSLGVDIPDPLFHPRGNVTEADRQLALAALSGRVGGDPGALAPAYTAPLAEMQKVLSACMNKPDKPCAPAEKKSLLAIEPTLTAGSGDHLVELKGPLATAATFAENLQLEYLEGMPDAEVGWGGVQEDGVRALMTLHSASSDLVQRTPEVARMQGAALLLEIMQTLDQAEQQKPLAGALGKPGDKVAVLVGHDTNISNVAALLDVHWLVNGYQRDDAPPGGALVFELWQRPGDRDAVKLYYTVQRPEQMRSALPLALKPAKSAPAKAEIFVPGCSHAEAGSPCNWVDFQHLLQVRSTAALAESTKPGRGRTAISSQRLSLSLPVNTKSFRQI